MVELLNLTPTNKIQKRTMNDYDKNELKEHLQDYCDTFLEGTQKQNFYICPFCGSGTGKHKTAAFHLFTETQFKCHSCGKSGDVFNLIMEIEHLTFTQALDRAHELYGSPDSMKPMLSRMVTRPKRETIIRLEPEKPSDEWQLSIMPIVKRAQTVIFEDAGISALDYLHSRGIDDQTIKDHGIGYIPPVKSDSWSVENGYSFTILSPFPGDQRKRLAIPYGITFPYVMDGKLYKLETRRLPEQVTDSIEKIGQVRGCRPSLFNADDAACTNMRRDILFTEGVIDAMSINQAVGRWCNDEIKAVTFGAATNQGDPNEFYKWYVMPYRVIVGFDNDEAGRIQGAELTDKITRARLDAGRNEARIAFPPERYKDWNEFMIQEPHAVFEYVSDLFPVTEF